MFLFNGHVRRRRIGAFLDRAIGVTVGVAITPFSFDELDFVNNQDQSTMGRSLTLPGIRAKVACDDQGFTFPVLLCPLGRRAKNHAGHKSGFFLNFSGFAFPAAVGGDGYARHRYA